MAKKTKKGQRGGKPRLTRAEVRAAVAKVLRGRSAAGVAREYGVTANAISYHVSVARKAS